NGDVDQPMPAFPYTADYFSGMTATTAALAALHKVRETGKGESSNGRVTTRYYSLLAGPSWKINNQLSLYSQVGPVLLHQRDH
ncbi:CoA transferase, partial [Salmonella enterica subsp. enterica serovar Anatum]|nr:CoA transferase [Salmonella enterica subsp. enterica serovar Anatum]